ncbi:proopiomelanocortin a [Narcine bancroftii]|uniref:proopiomelanocortin a n=1 Tax=Narcine bancroftii TaxID=1343680 RepID=UPI00383106F3
MMRRFWEVLPVLLSVWALASAQQWDCWEHNCLEGSAVPKGEECSDGCKAVKSLEFPIDPSNNQLQPMEENIRDYVMGHFRWNKFGKKRANNTGLSGSNREAERLQALLFQLPVREPPAHNMVSEGMDPQLPKQKEKRSYSMEHFRWGKPMGRKRRPVKVYPSSFENRSVENLGAELKRSESADFGHPTQVGGVEMEGGDQKKDGKVYKMTHFRWGRGPKDGELTLGPQHITNLQGLLQESVESGWPEEEVKKDGESYKFGHFRWSTPLKNKRYGGFMKSWDEKGQNPLLTLFRNVIIKDGHETNGQSQ